MWCPEPPRDCTVCYLALPTSRDTTCSQAQCFVECRRIFRTLRNGGSDKERFILELQSRQTWVENNPCHSDPEKMGGSNIGVLHFIVFFYVYL